MEKKCFKYFLGANSGEGFYHVFDKSYTPNGEWRAYIIKGGPGTGKSSFMKRFAAEAEGRGIKTLLCPCSSDPDSLDAVILPERKIVIMDGTAPHTVDPAFPGACEKILNFGEFWTDGKFGGKEQQIIGATLRNKAYHRSASRYIRAIGQLVEDNYKTSLACTDRQKAQKFALSVCKRYIPSGCGQSLGEERVRFIGGITPKGFVSYPDTVCAEADNIIIIDDVYGGAASVITEFVRAYALKCGYDVISLKNPFLPSLIYDHIIIPELRLAVVTENAYTRFNCDARRIHSRRFVSQKQLHLSRGRLKFNKKAADSLLSCAAGTLAGAKEIHDEIESYYIEAMDFEALNKFAEEFIRKTLDRADKS